MTTKDLDAFFDTGWNQHDVDFLMTFMADDCVFEGAAGSEVCGTRHAGRERVRGAFARVFEVFPDARFEQARHLVVGDRGPTTVVFRLKRPQPSLLLMLASGYSPIYPAHVPLAEFKNRSSATPSATRWTPASAGPDRSKDRG